jgi:membrane-associated phospholipid phosphatase
MQQAGEYHIFPAYKLLLPYVPLGVATFIAGTRYFDFRNHGFDVLAGAVIGFITSWLGFRVHHASFVYENGDLSPS